MTEIASGGGIAYAMAAQAHQALPVLATRKLGPRVQSSVIDLSQNPQLRRA